MRTSPDSPDAVGRPSLWQLGMLFLRLGSQAFGGLGAALGLLERELVDRQGWLTHADLRDSLTYTKPLPGSTVVQVVTFLGWRLRGTAGAGLATAAFLIPSVLGMTAAAAGSAVLPDIAAVRAGLVGLQVAVVGVLGATTMRLLRSEARSPTTATTAAAAVVAGLFVNAAVVVIAAGLVAVTASLARQRITRRGGGQSPDQGVDR